MDNIFFLILGSTFGATLMYFGYNKFIAKNKKEAIEKQSIMLLDKIKTVCKLVVVEGEFAEIYHHKNDKEYLFGLLSSSKKALLIVNAKVHIGFDLKKILLQADNSNRKIILKEFPQPEVISFENNYKFYDIDNGMFNKFKPEEISQLNEDAKKFILDKIPDSSLMQTAQKEALQSILIMETIVQTIGWKLDYKALKIDPTVRNLLN